MYKQVHIVGPSGSGTSSVTQAVCKITGHVQMDSDDYFWLPTDDPFTVIRDREECHALIATDFERHERWILSGSITGWAERFNPLFDLVIYMYVPHDERLKRIEKRERERYGDDALEGGRYHQKVAGFLEWCGSYETGTDSGRNLRNHEAWLERIDCRIERVVNDTFDQTVRKIVELISE